ncbi:MAG: histidine kinase dimerization/phospho-acceptor domain-containing protein, partial [Isosphaeraceae bacterium]
ENIHPDDRQHAFETIEEASRLPSPWHDVYRYVHPVEGERWIEGWSAPQVEPDGSILWHGFVMDVTARKQVEEEIQSLNVSLERRVAERTAELESMLANATIGLAFFDRDIRFIRINNCLARMNGVPIADHIGRPLREVLPTIADTVEPMLRRVFDTGRPVTEMELEGTIAAHPGERRFWLHSIYPVPGQDGTVISVGAAVTDITEQKRAQEKLAAANAELAGAARLKDEFLASMSHELRTPLNGILGMSEGLQEHVYGPLNLQQLRAVRDVEECGRHLLALINDILDVAKIEAGKVDLKLAPVTVEDVCQASLRLVKDSALKKKITVSLQLDKLVRVLTADERRLKQVLVNLLSNAVKFTAQGGRVGLDVVGEVDKRQV